MRVLVACEFSGVVRNAFLDRGHDAWSCDLLPALHLPSRGRHIRGDVTPLLEEKWDLVIAHPPCTYLANSGVRWLKNADGSLNKHRYRRMMRGVKFFQKCLNASATRVAVENPVPHIYARYYMGSCTQIIQPWQFGHGETKAACLRLRGLPLLRQTCVHAGRQPRSHRMPPSPQRCYLRSITCGGIAVAMADQWGG